MASELRSRCEMTNQEIIETIKYLNFCGLCTTGDCKNCARKIAKDKVLSLLELERYMINEKKLIEDIKEWSNERKIKWTSESIISLLESAHKISNWIPCKDKLPELNEGTDVFKQSKCVLVNIKWYDGDLSQDVAWLNENGSWSCESYYQKDVCKVIAWQPLPDDYIE